MVSVHDVFYVDLAQTCVSMRSLIACTKKTAQQDVVHRDKYDVFLFCIIMCVACIAN